MKWASRVGKEVNIAKVVPKALGWHSSAEDAREWMTLTMAGKGGPNSSKRDESMINVESLTDLVKHLREQKVPFRFLDIAEDPGKNAAKLIGLADVDGDNTLCEREFDMLWELCASPARPMLGPCATTTAPCR